MKSKFVYEKGEIAQVKNEDIACKGCIFAYDGRAIDCVIYNQKPLSVLDGGHCEKKQQAK